MNQDNEGRMNPEHTRPEAGSALSVTVTCSTKLRPRWIVLGLSL